MCILALFGFILFIALIFIEGDRASDHAEGAATTVDLPRYSKNDIKDAALRFLETHVALYDPQTYVTYQTHKDFSGYLTKNELLFNYVRQYGDTYPLDYFTVEVADSPSNSFYLVDVSMASGQVIGWSDRSVEGLGQGSIAQWEQAAANYLVQQGYDLQQFAIIGVPLDRGGVIYESNSHIVGQSHLRLTVDVYGTTVSGFHAAFSVPDEYAYWFEEQNQTASILSSVSIVLSLVMTIFAIVFTIIYRRQIKFSRGILLTFIFLSIYLIGNFNAIPALRAMEVGQHRAISAINQIDIGTIVFIVVIALLLTIPLYFFLLSGQAMWSKQGNNPWPHWNENHFGEHTLRSMGRGYLLAIFILGVQQLLFFIGRTQFQVWTVNDASDSLFNLALPALFPLTGWLAGISEEAAYRLFGIALFKKLLRNNFLAVLVPSMIWALGHTLYPVYPVYTRFFEVTILGIIFGYIFLKYGFITALFAHVSMDLILMGLSLMFVGELVYIPIGLLYVASPAIIGYLIYRVHRWKKREPYPHPPIPIHPEVS